MNGCCCCCCCCSLLQLSSMNSNILFEKHCHDILDQKVHNNSSILLGNDHISLVVSSISFPLGSATQHEWGLYLKIWYTGISGGPTTS